MYDIELMDNLFSEGELLCMPEEFMITLRNLLDDKLSLIFNDFFRKFYEAGIQNIDEDIAIELTQQVRLLYDTCFDAIKANLFHLEVQDREIHKKLESITIDTALAAIQDRKTIMEDFQWLLDNRQYWRSTTVKRRKEDYEDLLSFADLLESMTTSRVYEEEYSGSGKTIKRYSQLQKRIEHNKEIFYSYNEKVRSTRMGLIMSSATTIKAVLHGLQYQQHCDDHKLRRDERLRFG